MSELLTILALAFLWAFLAGNLTVYNLFVGALIGLVLLSVVQRGDSNSFPRRLLGVAVFCLSFFKELLVANIAIARLALSPRPRLSPHVLAVPLRLQSDAAITLLAATITLLPGTVAMGVSEDRKFLYAHAIGEADIDKARDSVTRIERLILRFMS